MLFDSYDVIFFNFFRSRKRLEKDDDFLVSYFIKIKIKIMEVFNGKHVNLIIFKRFNVTFKRLNYILQLFCFVH